MKVNFFTTSFAFSIVTYIENAKLLLVSIKQGAQVKDVANGPFVIVYICYSN